MPSTKRRRRINSVAVIGNYLPRQCGIATFTTDLCSALSAARKRCRIEVVAMDDILEGYKYPERVKFQVQAGSQPDYLRAADFLNVSLYDVVILEHEYGIFGGQDGSHILHLLKPLKMPIITTLHTVLEEPPPNQRFIIKELAKYSDRLVVMSHKAKALLHDVYGIEKKKTAYLPHGIPDLPFADPSFTKDQFDIEGKKMILTFGLLGPGKGIEVMIEAMPKVIEKHPDAVYFILGATHPHIKQRSGDSYRHGLHQLVNRLSIEDHVLFHNQFVEEELLSHYLTAADVYVTPYLSREQITSGTLAFALGAGKAVVSTPYWYAEELLADKRGILVPFNDSEALAAAVCDLLDHDRKRNAMRKRAYQYARSMVWNEVGRGYFDLMGKALEKRIVSPRPRAGAARVLEELPEPKLRHLRTLTDETGILQHATYATPNRRHGYCVDDNARALVVLSKYSALSEDPSLLSLLQVYLSYLHDAFDRETRRFKNFMSYDRKWLEEVGSEDSNGRALWGLGATVKTAPNDSVADFATRLFVEALPRTEEFTSPRAWAFTLVGLHSYLEVYSGDAAARRLRALLADKLHRLFKEHASGDWPWFEDRVTYANGKIPHALLLSGQWIPNPEMHLVGLKTLAWLLKQQTAPQGHLTVIGNEGWLSRDGERPKFDQQPIEVMALVEACAEAYRSTGDDKWLQEGRKCIGWFLGRNDLQVPLYIPSTGGCCDGLQPHGANANQGAEATLAWLVSIMTMYEIMGQQPLVA